MRTTYASRGKKQENKNPNGMLFEPDSEDPDEVSEMTQEQNEMDLIKQRIDQIDTNITKLGGIQSCGWDPADHKDFLRIKTKHNNKTGTVAFLTEMKRAVPSIDETEI